MNTRITNIISESSVLKSLDAEEDYASILSSHSIKYETTDRYLLVGRPSKSQGWILHITVIPNQMTNLLDRILPKLIELRIPYKIIKNEKLHKNLNGGDYGRFKIGKVITIFLDNDTIVTEITKNLIEVTAGYTGPQIFTDFYLGNIVYARYGSFIPLIEMDAFGNKVRVLQDAEGTLVMDKYYAPPLVLSGIPNPFIDFIHAKEKPSKLYLIGNKYMPVKMLKSDAKGDVWKALRFTRFLVPKWCVVKQARKGMFPDRDGRDVRSRLDWQHEVNKEIKNVIPTPVILDRLEEGGHLYIAMEYVSGAKDLMSFIHKKLDHTAWFALPLQTKLEVLDCLQQVIAAITSLHWLGYVHRDITGTNFLVKANGKVQLIDLELIYSVTVGAPNPPFEVGTPGYMSPQQAAGHNRPEYGDDSYSLGALMVMAFAGGMNPLNILDKDLETLRTKLLFLVGDKLPVDLVIQCLSEDPAERPDIEAIQSAMKNYINSLRNKALSEIKLTGNLAPKQSNFLQIKKTIQQAIESLSGEQLAHKKLWYSYVENDYGEDVYPLMNKHIFAGLYRGIGGTIYLVGRLQQLGFNIDAVRSNLDEGLNYILSELATNLERMAPSLYLGRAGLALTLSRGIESGLLDDKPYYRERIAACLSHASPALDLFYGVAGQGMAALQCGAFLGGRLSELLVTYSNLLLREQQKDGSWFTTYNEPKKITKANGLGLGIAGIAYFLLELASRYADPKLLEAARQGLYYLKNRATWENGCCRWPVSNQNKSKDDWWYSGGPGIALAFLKGYEITKDSKYLMIAEAALSIHPKYIVYYDLGQCNGLSGLGEVYLEAYRITGNLEWWTRATWIANLLMNFKKSTRKASPFWLVERNDFPTADFMIGNSGVVHFLLRFCFPDKLGFPLFP